MPCKLGANPSTSSNLAVPVALKTWRVHSHSLERVAGSGMAKSRTQIGSSPARTAAEPPHQAKSARRLAAREMTNRDGVALN